MMRKITILLYTVLLVAMAAATLVEQARGTEYAALHVYGTWWFCLLWAALTAVSVIVFFRRRVRRLSLWLLHGSMAVILLGALLTFLTSSRGVVHLRQGTPVNTYLALDDAAMRQRPLPFTLRLDRFQVIYHEGTSAPADYRSEMTVETGNGRHAATVSMNRIVSESGVRLYQNDYDKDMRGTYLTVNRDPWGIPVTYAGYGLLFVSLLWLLLDPQGTFRRLQRHPLLRGAALLLFLLSFSSPSQAQRTLSRATADAFGRLLMVHDDRVMTVESFATDFTRKISGRSSYRDFTAVQVLAGFVFYPDDWCKQPVLKVKRGVFRSTIGLPARCSFNTFFNPATGDYTLRPYIEEYYGGNQDKFHSQAADIDDRLFLIQQVRQGTLLRLFPAGGGEKSAVRWLAPGENLPGGMSPEAVREMNAWYAAAKNDAETGAEDHLKEMIQALHDAQLARGGASLPTPLQLKAARVYNHFPFVTWLFMLNLALGLLMLVSLMTSRRLPLARLLMLMSWLVLTFGIALRWAVRGNIPLSNGYETMLATAWCVLLIALSVSFRQEGFVRSFILMAGFTVSGCFLLVSHLGQMNPEITCLMPVLNSPLLSLHVSVVMIAYAFLSLTFVCALSALLVRRRDEVLALLSRLFLYPAVAALGIGIFLGAVWANVSWGRYWSWDPKETWALITFMVYALPLHQSLFPLSGNQKYYHIYMAAAFLTLLMTYFGVNYLLGGMHSYA